MLDQVADRVTALVFAPEKLADRFDEHGCICPAAWLKQEIPFADDQMEVADDPVDQAEAVVRILAGFDGRYNTEQIAIGVPDEQIVPYLQQRLQECDVPARYGVGKGVRPFRPLPPAGRRRRLCRDLGVLGLCRPGAASFGPRLACRQGDRGRLAEPDGPLPGRALAPRPGWSVARGRPGTASRSNRPSRPSKACAANCAASRARWPSGPSRSSNSS